MSRTEGNGGDFWSRRKAAVAAEAEADEAAEAAQEIEARRADLDGQPDEEILTKLDLPDPDTLKPGDDFAAFMRDEVPARLRQRALRRLWRSNPVLANLDSLVDYGEDFTDASTVIENLQTTYRVGKGMLSHILAQEEAAKAKAADEDAPTEPEAEAANTAAPEPDATGSRDAPPPADPQPAQDIVADPEIALSAQTAAAAPVHLMPEPNTVSNDEADSLTDSVPLRRMRFSIAPSTADTQEPMA